MAKVTVSNYDGESWTYEGNAGLAPGNVLIITEKVPDLMSKEGTDKDKMIAMFHSDSWSKVECEH